MGVLWMLCVHLIVPKSRHAHDDKNKVIIIFQVDNYYYYYPVQFKAPAWGVHLRILNVIKDKNVCTLIATEQAKPFKKGNIK